jgi:PAS domain S-box-containing protein
MQYESPTSLDLESQVDQLKRDLAASEARLAAVQSQTRADAAHWRRLVAIVEGSRDAIWSWNLEGIIDSWNGEAERLFQYRSEEIIGRSVLVLVPSSRMENARIAIAKLLTGVYYEQYETVRVRKDGTPIPVELTVSPIKAVTGELIGIATICRDISARVQQEEAMRASEARYRAAVITGRIGAWETNMVSRTRVWTDEGMQLFGLSLPDGRGRVGGPDDEFWNALHPDDKHMMKEFHRTADTVDSYPCEYRIIRPDGTMLWVSGRGRVMARSPEGKAQLVANMVMDVTERKNAEHQVQLLLRESTHRSKNLLAVVHAIASQTAHGSATLAEFQDKFGERLRALAASHDLLVEGGWHGAEVEELVKQQLAPFAERGVGFELSGPRVVLSASVAQTLGLALHELATNATKYGAWSLPQGNVAIRWDVAAGQKPRLHLSWAESGGPLVEMPLRKGFGHVVFEYMVEQSAQGEVKIDYDPAGLRWNVSLPTDAIAE